MLLFIIFIIFEVLIFAAVIKDTKRIILSLLNTPTKLPVHSKVMKYQIFNAGTSVLVYELPPYFLKDIFQP